MAQNPPARCQRIIPYLIVPDVGKQMDFLIDVFGFEERDRVGPPGEVMHGEVGLEDNLLMMGASREGCDGYKAMVYVYVDDVDAYYAKAKEAGCEFEQEIADQFYGDRSFGIKDPSGNSFWFATHTHDPTPEEMMKAMAEMENCGG